LDSVFRALEPVTENTNEGETTQNAQPQPPIVSTLNLWSQEQDWFRVYRDFFFGCDSYDLLFLNARIVVLCSEGFEIMDPSDFTSVTIPQRDDIRLKKFVKRIKSCRPIGMFKLDKDEFLLCYNEFGLYVDSHGDPSRAGIVQWEGMAERVARYPPYILLFNNRFIEIRHVKTGHLVQITSGNNMRCIWDGRGTNQPQPISEGSGDEVVPQGLKVYGVMDVEAPRSGKRGATTQRVFELVPKVLEGPVQ